MCTHVLELYILCAGMTFAVGKIKFRLHRLLLWFDSSLVKSIQHCGHMTTALSKYHRLHLCLQNRQDFVFCLPICFLQTCRKLQKVCLHWQYRYNSERRLLRCGLKEHCTLLVLSAVFSISHHIRSLADKSPCSQIISSLWRKPKCSEDPEETQGIGANKDEGVQLLLTGAHTRNRSGEEGQESRNLKGSREDETEQIDKEVKTN